MFFVESHKRTLIDLKISSEYGLSADKCFQLLSTLSENLKTLSASNLPGELASMRTIVFKNLEELEWYGDEGFNFQAWQTPKLKKFLYEKTSKHFLRRSNSRNMVNFLRNQPQLKVLDIRNTFEFEELLNAAELSPFPFRLENLGITLLRNWATNFCPFLENHKDSLKVFTLRNANLRDEELRCILSLNLEELVLKDNFYYSLGPCTNKSQTIKKLTFSQKSASYKINLVVEACPMVEVLSLKGCTVSNCLSKSIASSLHHMKHLSLNHIVFTLPFCEMDRFASLETLTAYHVESKTLNRFILKNPQIKSIKVEKSYTDYVPMHLLRFLSMPRTQIFVSINVIVHLNIYIHFNRY